jgi:hypothetical protein
MRPVIDPIKTRMIKAVRMKMMLWTRIFRYCFFRKNPFRYKPTRMSNIPALKRIYRAMVGRIPVII